MIVFASILGAILATGLLALNPSTITNVGAQMYGNQYGYDSNYYQDDNRYSYDNNHQKKSSHADIQKIKCVNSNINVNGIDITQIPHDTATAAANEAGTEGTNTQNGNGFADKINFNRNLVNICVNVNHNQQVKISPPDEEPQPPETCEECLQTGLGDQLQTFEDFLADNQLDLQGYCDLLAALPSYNDIQNGLLNDFGPGFADLENPEQLAQQVVNCLMSIEFLPPP